MTKRNSSSSKLAKPTLRIDKVAVNHVRSTNHIDVINDVSLIIANAHGIADMLSVAPVDELTEETIQQIGFAVRDLMRQALDRICEAGQPAQEANHA